MFANHAARTARPSQSARILHCHGQHCLSAQGAHHGRLVACCAGSAADRDLCFPLMPCRRAVWKKHCLVYNGRPLLHSAARIEQCVRYHDTSWEPKPTVHTLPHTLSALNRPCTQSHSSEQAGYPCWGNIDAGPSLPVPAADTFVSCSPCQPAKPTATQALTFIPLTAPPQRPSRDSPLPSYMYQRCCRAEEATLPPPWALNAHLRLPPDSTDEPTTNANTTAPQTRLI